MLIDLVSFVRLCLMQLKKQTPNSDTNIYLPQVCVYLQATVTQVFWSPTSLLGYPWAIEHARSIWYGQNCALLPLSSVSMHLLPPVHPPQGCQTLYSIMQICLGSLHGQNPPITYRIKSKLQEDEGLPQCFSLTSTCILSYHHAPHGFQPPRMSHLSPLQKHFLASVPYTQGYPSTPSGSGHSSLYESSPSGPRVDVWNGGQYQTL